MAQEKKIDFVISVRDRDNPRIQRCIDSLKPKNLGTVYVVDYGSKVPVKVKGCKIIRVNNGNIWNKAHALNIGIKKCKNHFIGTVDCDMVISPDFFDKCDDYLVDDCFIFTRNVKRIKPEITGWGLSFDKMETISENWIAGKRLEYHTAVGGIQIFSKEWIHAIRGNDENLTYWGGIDNDIHDRAYRTGLVMVDINELILHQEHILKKEENLTNPEEAGTAINLRRYRTSYLQFKYKNNLNVGPAIWGVVDRPQQNTVKMVEQDEKKSPNRNNKQ